MTIRIFVHAVQHLIVSKAVFKFPKSSHQRDLASSAKPSLTTHSTRNATRSFDQNLGFGESNTLGRCSGHVNIQATGRLGGDNHRAFGLAMAGH